MTNAHNPKGSRLDMPLARLRQWPALFAIVALVALVGCQAAGPRAPAKFQGAIVGDEAQSMLAARQVLLAGGSAADAAVALTFALSATYPSAASLGGGGQCVVYVRLTGGDRILALDFLPGRASEPTGDGWASAVPGTVRGMDALHGRFGRLPWSRTLQAAERLARHGHPVSRALAADLLAGGDALNRDPAARAIFSRSDGLPYSVARSGGIPRALGQTIVQRDLWVLLTRLRRAGAADFYTGLIGRLLVKAVDRTGGTLRAEDLAGYQAHWRGTLSLAAANKELHTVPGSGGAVATAIWALAGAEGRYAEAEEAERYRLLAEAGQRAFSQPPIASEGALERDALASAAGDDGAESGTAPEGDAGPVLSDVPTTSFAIVDRNGMAVACGLTMNELFGAGRLAPGTGIVLAAPPEPNSASPIAPVVLVNRQSEKLHLAASAGGGRVAPSALATVLLALIDDERPLGEAVTSPRVHVKRAADSVTVEPWLDAATRAELEARGHRVVEVPVIGRVNAIHCPDGVSREATSCRDRSDGRRASAGAGESP